MAAWLWPSLSSAQSSSPGMTAGPDSDQSGSNTEIAKKLQNPVADLISVPFQSNTNFGFGPMNGTQEVLKVQPVVPFHLTDDWNLITRTIMPLTWNPAVTADGESSFGLGNTVLSLFLSPAHPGKWIWGAGPAILLPATNTSVGSNLWGGGSIVCGAADGWSLGLWRTGQQSLVLRRADRAWWQQGELVHATAIRELQFRRWLVCHILPDHHCQLAERGEGMDATGRRRRW
jgi:hypothetical protein